MRFVVALVAWAALLPGLAWGAGPFRVCVLEYDGPLADKASGKGFDLDVGRAVAEKLGRPFEAVWIPNEAKMTEVDDSDLPIVPLIKGKCDAVPSVPGPDALGELRPYIALSTPYYGAGFELVGPKGTATDLRALRGQKVSVQSVTVAHGVAEAIGLRWSAQPTPAEQIASLDNHDVDAAIIWGPALGDFGRDPVTGYTPPSLLRWNESFATRASDAELTQAVNTALAQLVDEGEIAKLQKAHGIPQRAPFEKTFDPGEMRMLQLQGASQQTPKRAENSAAIPPIASGTPEKDNVGGNSAAAVRTESIQEPASNASPAKTFEKEPAAVRRGKLIYTGTCGAYCHPASAGSGSDAPYLFDCAWKHGATDQDIFHTIKTGVKGTRMVSFDGALTDEDIWKVIAYLRAHSACKAHQGR